MLFVIGTRRIDRHKPIINVDQSNTVVKPQSCTRIINGIPNIYLEMCHPTTTTTTRNDDDADDGDKSDKENDSP